MKRNREIIYLAGFLFSIPVALTSYINSSFLEKFISESYVGIIYVGASILTILGLTEIPKLLTRIGNRRATLWLSISILISFVLLAFATNTVVAISAFVLYFISINLIVAALDIFVEDFSGRGSIGGFRGFYMAVLSLAWVVAQLVSGLIIDKVSFKGIYLLSAFFMVFVSLIFTFTLRNFVDPQYTKIPVFNIMKTFWMNKNISRIYIVNLILKFFYAWMIIYTPIYLNQHIGLGWDQIGIIFAIMITPFVILDFPLGRLSDKIGEKKLLIGGLAIMSISTLIIPFIGEPKVWLWALVLFATRVGAATVDTMTESYFFKNIEEENVNVLSFYRNTTPLSYVISPLVAIGVLYFVPSFEYLFVVLGAVLTTGLFISLRLKDVT